jgi:quercetin dioxygenase-like cupin family protein
MNDNDVFNIPFERRTIVVLGEVYRFLATGEDTNGTYALWEMRVPAAAVSPLHVHSREAVGFYVLNGEITFRIGSESVVARAGTFLNMPVGTPHSFKNDGNRPAQMLVSVAPAGVEKMFFEIGVPLTEEATTASLPTNHDIEKLLEVAPEYGVSIVPRG